MTPTLKKQLFDALETHYGLRLPETLGHHIRNRLRGRHHRGLVADFRLGTLGCIGGAMAWKGLAFLAELLVALDRERK